MVGGIVVKAWTTVDVAHGGSAYSALCNGWAVVKRDCICSKEQLSKRVASGGGCVCRPKLVNRKGGDPRYPDGA